MHRFRWVECQLNTLKKCMTRAAVQKALKQLPVTLDDTYDRILMNIPEEYHSEAHCAFQLMVVACRPVTLAEVAEAVSFDYEKCKFDAENRLRDLYDLLEICSTFVVVSLSRFVSSDWQLMFRHGGEELRFVHYSVKEYLLSSRILRGTASSFSVSHPIAHDLVAKMSLVYLLSFNEPTSMRSETLTEFPLLQYAAEFWYTHYGNKTTNDDLVMRLFDLTSGSHFICWLMVHDPEHPLESPFSQNHTRSTPLYYSSRLGLVNIAKSALQMGADPNAVGGKYGNALQAASFVGNDAVVRLLLDNRAEINVAGGYYGNALQAASCEGHDGIVEVLLQHGAEVNAQGGEYGNALQGAARHGHKNVVKLLLEAGANDVIQGYYGTALQTAASGGYDEIVKLLLESTADVSAQGGRYGNALQGAALCGHKTVVGLLLKSGADVNAEGGYYGNALQAAAYGGHKDVVDLLLGLGGDARIQGGRYGNAFQAARAAGHCDIEELLLRSEMDITGPVSQHGSTVEALGLAIQDKIQNFLLQLTVEVNARRETADSAFEEIATERYRGSVKLPSEARPKPKKYGEAAKKAMEEAAYQRQDEIARLILQAAVEATARGGSLNTVWHVQLYNQAREELVKVTAYLIHRSQT